MFLWVLTCCVSRVALGKHFPGDVVAGVCIGAVIGKSGFPIQPAMGWERTILGSIFTIESAIQVFDSTLQELWRYIAHTARGAYLHPHN